MKRNYKPEGVPTLFPYLTVRDAKESILFYQNAFQFTLRDVPAEDEGKIVHAELAFEDTVIMLAPENAWGSVKKAPKSLNMDFPLSLYVYVRDVDAYFKNAVQHKAEIISEPEDTFWGDRFCQLRDIDGYEWSFATHIGEHDKSLKASKT